VANHEDVYNFQAQGAASIEAVLQNETTQPYFDMQINSGIPISSNTISSFPNVDIDDLIFSDGGDPNSLNAGTFGSYSIQPMNDASANQSLIPNPVPNLDRHTISANTFNPPGMRTAGKSRHRCQWSTCTKSFGRKSDLERHISTVHLKAKTYFCPVYGCSKSLRLGRPYSRLDKLQEHMRLKHAT
jgi:uncharacterized Zn-finger protein